MSVRNHRVGRRAAMIALSVTGLWTASPARASGQETGYYTRCYASAGFGSAYSPSRAVKYFYVSGPIAAGGNDQQTYARINQEWNAYVSTLKTEVKIESTGCGPFASESEIKQIIANNTRPQSGVRFHEVDWQPSFVKPQGPLKFYNLSYQEGAQAGHGYDSASIRLNYRFLLCADEIQVAYGIDRKSLQHSERYVVRPKGMGNMEYAVPRAEPQAPTSVPLNLRVTKKLETAITTVARLRDQVAGESLGMGCFTGQTQKLGLVGAMVGPKATREQIKAFLDSLVLASAASTVTADIDFPLTNAEFPPPPPAAHRTTSPKHGKRG